nr:hypothetical protein [Tanacetum cinerariifolium]
MSYFDESGVTYTDISSPFEELLDIGSPRANDHEHLMLPEMLEDPYVEVALQAPPSPDYIHGPDEPEQAPPSPDYVPGPEHADDEIVAEDQPYAEDASPIAQSPEYVPESDLEAHPEDDDDEDPEEDPVDYLADGGDDGDHEEESSEDDEDDDMDVEANDEEEEEEHPAPADSIVREVGYRITDSWDEIVETLDGRAHAYTRHVMETEARMSIEAWVRATDVSDLVHGEVMSLRTTVLGQMLEIRELQKQMAPRRTTRSTADQETINATSVNNAQLQAMIDQGVTAALAARDALRTPPPSPIHSLGYRTAMIRLRDEDASTSSTPLQLPSASRREDRPGVTLPPRKRFDIALGPRYEVGESSSARPAGGFRADYGFVDTGAPVSTDTELGRYVREFETRVRQDTDEIYMRLDDEQTERQLLAGRLNMLFMDRRAHAYTHHMMETEARMSREAWVRATDVSDLVHGEVMSLRTTVLCQMSEIRELQAADRRRQTVISELLRIDHRRSTEIL